MDIVFPNWFWILTTSLLSLAMIFTIIRLLIGPTVSDRIVALDLLAAILMVAFMQVGIQFKQPYYLSVALAIAVIVFLATVALAKYMEETEDLK